MSKITMTSVLHTYSTLLSHFFVWKNRTQFFFWRCEWDMSPPLPYPLFSGSGENRSSLNSYFPTTLCFLENMWFPIDIRKHVMKDKEGVWPQNLPKLLRSRNAACGTSAYFEQVIGTWSLWCWKHTYTPTSIDTLHAHYIFCFQVVYFVSHLFFMGSVHAWYVPADGGCCAGSELHMRCKRWRYLTKASWRS